LISDGAVVETTLEGLNLKKGLSSMAIFRRHAEGFDLPLELEKKSTENSEGFRRHQGIAEGLSWRQIPQTSESTRKSLGRQL
jgi:predicted transposase YbfD/YdcC